MSETEKAKRPNYFPADSFKEKKKKIIKGLEKLKSELEKIRTSMSHDIGMSEDEITAEQQEEQSKFNKFGTWDY